MKKKELKKTIIFTALMILTILLISSVSAEYYNICLNKGEKIKFSKCNPHMDDYICTATKCNSCVNEISKGIYCPSNSCGALGGPCSSLGNTTIDLTPPNMTLNSPLDNEIYNSKSILVNISLGEKADLYYSDNADGKNKWMKICSDCDVYSKKKSFKEGFNNITFKAVDFLGHRSYVTRIFNIDSQAPRIHKTEPKEDFISTEFSVDYDEENVNSIKLVYGNILTGFKSKFLENCQSGKKQKCSTIFSLKEYDGQIIEYWFEITDLAGNIAVSKTIKAKVDETFPILNNPVSYYTQGVGINSRYLYFKFNVTEKNLDKITYSYLDSRNKTREIILCSKLDKNNICETKKSFTKGNYSITVQITDKASNMIGYPINFKVDY